MKLRVSGIVEESVVDGDGLRFALFVQGCKRACPGCQNKSTWDLNGGVLMDTEEILEKIDDPLLSGVTFSGGEPFLQAKALAELARKIHQKGLNIWCYTGDAYEEITERGETDELALLNNVDVLVDGDFREDLRDLTLKFRGSKNQRIIDVKETEKSNTIILKYA